MAKIRILIVDDSEAVRHGLHSILQSNDDFEVVGEAVDGEEGVRRADELKPDVVLMDAQMPSVSGIEATRQIKQSTPDIKIVILSVHVEHIDEGIAAGADCFLAKDSSRGELIAEIRRLGPAE